MYHLKVNNNFSRQFDIVVAIPIVTRTLYEMYNGNMPMNEQIECIHGKLEVYINYVQA